MKYEQIRERLRDQLIVMFRGNESRFLESLMTQDPPLSRELIEAEIKSLETCDQGRIEIFLEFFNHFFDEKSPRLAPLPIDRRMSGGRNSPA